MKLNILNKRIILDLFKSNEGLFIFTLYRRFKVPPRELFQAIQDLVSLNLIIEHEERITLTSKGKEFIIANNLVAQGHSNKFNKIPNKFLGPQIEINEFYLPSSLNIHDDLLNSHAFD